VLFVLRAAGDTGPDWMGWLSPFGWNTRVRAYGDVRWWLLAWYVATALALVWAAFALCSRRDLGSGLVPARPGPRTGSPRLADVFGLTLRTQGTTLLLWSVAAGVLGVVFGMIAPGVDDLLDAEVARSIVDELGGALVAAILSVVAVVLTYFSVAVVSHAGRDEADGRTELVLAAGTSRGAWFAASALLALVGSAWLLGLTGAGLWLGYAVADGPHVGNVLAAALAWVPATWVVGGLALACLAAGLRWSSLVWAWPAVFLTLRLVGDLLELPGWLTGLSPYAHVPSLPAEGWSWPSAAGLSAAAALVLVAWWRFRERDIG